MAGKKTNIERATYSQILTNYKFIHQNRKVKERETGKNDSSNETNALFYFLFFYL